MLVKEFCELYQIHPETFRKYRVKAEEQTGSPVVEKSGSRTYRIINLDAVLAVMPEETKERLKQAQPVQEQPEPVEVIDGEIEPDQPMSAFDRIVSGKLANVAPVSVPSVPARSLSDPSESVAEVNTRLAIRRQETADLGASLAQILEVARNVNEAYRQTLQAEGEQLTTQQVQLQDALTELEIQQELTRKEEIRQQAARRELEKTKGEVASKVIDLQDFFARRSGS